MVYKPKPKPQEVETIRAQMDEAALIAEREYMQLIELHPEALRAVRIWWGKHCVDAGYVRLARIVLGKTIK